MSSRNMVSKHRKIFDFLLSIYEKDNNFLFATRKINNKNRLAQGYWFIGNDRYLQVSFWEGMDWKEKIHNIGFVVLSDGSSYIELSGQDSDEKADFLKLIVNKLGGFKRIGKKNKWQRHYSDKKYLNNLRYFLKNDKPVMDQMIREHNPDEIGFLNENYYKFYIKPIIKLRDKQSEYGKINKIAKVCWNTENWQYPSGSKGKSKDPKSYESKYGYGHEEWLFDKSRIINGFHYAFLESLNVKSGKHVEKVYNVSLFTVEGSKRTFYVGDIKNVICISKEEAKKAYQTYKDNGWISEMAEEVKSVGANREVFLRNIAKFIFNIKFMVNDVCLLGELQEISDVDGNITTNRFKLLPKKTDFVIRDISNEGDESEGSLRDESLRKVVFKKDSEYDPYHSKMQNALTLLLREQYKHKYIKVCEEKSRVDIKAKTKDNEWHYFEIKTNVPKLCIRQALGQIMEYAYWPYYERAKKLIIIGDSLPDEDAKRYMEYIRGNFSIPVFYRCFNMEKKTLSEDF